MVKKQPKQTLAPPKPADPGPDDRWRVSIDLVDSPDFVIPFRSKSDALGEVDVIFRRGYVVQDRRSDPTRVQVEIFPLAQIKRIQIYQSPA